MDGCGIAFDKCRVRAHSDTSLALATVINEPHSVKV